MQAELRGVRFGGNRPLVFYSPYDKPGLSFRFAQRVPDQPVLNPGPKEPQVKKGPLVPMLGRVGVHLDGYANTAEGSLTPMRGVHAAGGTLYQDLWHVVLFGCKRSVTAICQPRRFAAVYWHELQRKPSRYESPTDNR
ncbi:MAG: hypothetical protein PF961_00760 [Planctomycetota bacterium]|nr:hypothetical protein [Planctomycetota bacterium]